MWLLGFLLLTLALPALPSRAVPPSPEPNFVGPVLPPRACAAEEGNPYENRLYAREGWAAPARQRYAGACERLRFVFGPIVIRPGQNDVLLQPVTIEKPAYDGYMVRFDPDMVEADGTVPPIEELHLHHAVWTSQSGQYGNGPFAASGEEKTIFSFPRGYGMPVRGADQWQLLYMVHSAVQQPTEVFITYDIDYIPVAKAEGLGLRPAYPIWLDVGTITSRPAYPVFNVQRGYGVNGKCQWPAQQCAAFDPFGGLFIGQGMEGNGRGVDWRLPNAGGSIGRIRDFQGGSLIMIGGHLHPGGLTNDIDLVRGSRVRRIYTGEAVYWDWKNPTRAGGPPNSWDFSMTVASLPDWGIRVRPGDVIRSNATYDATLQSTYENMGIAVALLAPDLPDLPPAPGLDPFNARSDRSPDCNSGGLARGALCDRGSVTHGHMKEADNHGQAKGGLEAKRGEPTSRVDIAAFTYQPGDLALVSMNGIPTVKLGQKLKFFNADVALGDILHTVTSCAYPCTGATGIAFPLADGRSNKGRPIDFDSGELGYGPPLGAAKNAIDWDVELTPANGFHRGGTYTYFCRIHPGMRGAFEVT